MIICAESGCWTNEINGVKETYMGKEINMIEDKWGQFSKWSSGDTCDQAKYR